jgi:hypothetical protein
MHNIILLYRLRYSKSVYKVNEQRFLPFFFLHVGFFFFSLEKNYCINKPKKCLQAHGINDLKYCALE